MPRRVNLRRQRLRWLVIGRLSNTGMGPQAIAECTGYSPAFVRATLESPSYCEWLNASVRNAVSLIDAEMAKDTIAMREGISELVPAVIRRLERALSSDDDSVALRACSEILDRDARFGKTQIYSVKHEIIPGKELESARKLARELRKHTLDITPQPQPLLVSDTEQGN